MTKTNLTTLIDAYGRLKAQLAELEAQELGIKRELADLRPGAYEGEAYRLTVSESDRATRDEAFKQRIENLIETHVSPQYVRAHTKLTPIRTHRVMARNGNHLTKDVT
jgi:hypothetical protein